MKIYTLQFHNELKIGIELEKGMLDFSAAYQAYHFFKDQRMMVRICTIGDLINRGKFSEETFLRVFDFLESHNLWDHHLLRERFQPLAPILRPGKIIALGLNYTGHAQESEKPVPEEPILFTKTSSTVIGPEQPICIPEGVGRVDHELELAVIIGKTAKKIPKESALDVVAGYTVFNDVTARAMQWQDIEAKLPWYRSKNFDTFGPMGPCLLTKKEVGFPIELEMELRVNGETRQKANSREMVFDIPSIIAYITRWITLEPGDVIATGTPEGISEIHPGDVVEAEIEKIGILRNRVESSGSPN